MSRKWLATAQVMPIKNTHRFVKSLRKPQQVLGTFQHGGLSSAVAKVRLKQDGANELPASGERSLWGIAWEVVREPMFMLLVAAGVIYLLLGDVSDALMLLGF
ncbi:MAG TPA: cation-transporting P-type ATPase, partial [Methylotenera sp.]